MAALRFARTLACTVGLVSGCASQTTPTASPPPAPASEAAIAQTAPRVATHAPPPTAGTARTPTVSAFRCALDNRPGMLVIDLGNSVYAAWDTREGILYKVWTGDVELTGTVYDTRHGPRPKARGTVLYAALPTTRESETLATRPAHLAPPADIVRLGQTGTPGRVWRGHRVEPDRVVLLISVDGREQSLAFSRAPTADSFPVLVTPN